MSSSASDAAGFKDVGRDLGPSGVTHVDRTARHHEVCSGRLVKVASSSRDQEPPAELAPAHPRLAPRWVWSTRPLTSALSGEEVVAVPTSSGRASPPPAEHLAVGPSVVDGVRSTTRPLVGHGVGPGGKLVAETQRSPSTPAPAPRGRGTSPLPRAALEGGTAALVLPTGRLDQHAHLTTRGGSRLASAIAGRSTVIRRPHVESCEDRRAATKDELATQQRTREHTHGLERGRVAQPVIGAVVVHERRGGGHVRRLEDPNQDQEARPGRDALDDLAAHPGGRVVQDGLARR